MWRTLLRVATFTAVVVAVLAFPTAWTLDRVAGADLVSFRPFDEATVAANRATTDARDDASVVGIYGTPFDAAAAPERYLFVPSDRVIRPAEKPALALYAKGLGENPLQARTVWWIARFTAIGAAIAALVGAVLLRVTRRGAPVTPAT